MSTLFMDENFLLKSETARTLYHDYAKHMPIFDYHCHLNPKDIAEDAKFSDMAQVWLGTDHYKWRLMRANDVEEDEITGKAEGLTKFKNYAAVLPKAIGNPLYHFSHLELKNYFGFEKPLSPETADEAWGICNEKLGQLSVRQILKDSNVKALCTTDDPIDTLEWHKQIREDESFQVKVLPTFRPDRALNIEKSEFCDYIARISEASGVKISSLESLKEALLKTMDHFTAHGCIISDHGIAYPFFRQGDAKAVFDRALAGKQLTWEDVEIYKTDLMLFLGKSYHERNWTMQLHYNVQRNVNTKLFNTIGADVGGDCISTKEGSTKITAFLDGLSKEERLPRMILYSLNPGDDPLFACISGCYSNVRMGTAWWFNDTKVGMESQMTTLASMSLFGNFLGMLTDSRSFLSYARHEYFRRLLCNLIGQWVENGEYPNDPKSLKQLVEDICYNNACDFLRL